MNPNYLFYNPDPFWTKFQLKEEPHIESGKISQQDISSRVDEPFQYGCTVPNTDQPRANAALVMLARNSEIKDVITSMQSMERHFNQWYNYPWVFLNDEQFTTEFKQAVRKHTKSEVEFGVIEPEVWDFPKDVDRDEIKEYITKQGDRGILYGNMESYHKMCRFYSGQFYQHDLIKNREWYWRVEPNVEFYCDLTYDPFIEMEKRGKKYGFNVMLNELYYTVPGLFREIKSFIKEQNIQVKNAWRLFIHDSKWTTGANQDEYDGIFIRPHILKEIEENVVLDKFLAIKDKKDEDVKKFNPTLIHKLFSKATQLPALHEDRMDREDYNLCHFWSNFEIARPDIFTSEVYQKLFKYLDSTGGFYKERWGDAPIHSLAIGMMLDLKEIHYFRDIGYRHSNFIHCPRNSPKNQLEYVPSDTYQGNKKDKHWLFPDKPRKFGAGCRCRCPRQRYTDTEDGGDSCMPQWKKHTDDNFRVFRQVDTDELENNIKIRVDKYLADGGVLGEKFFY
ncbi:mannosyltransferase of the KRE2 family [Spathaspora passalidarum NRRL Y-27907]|uniref:Mannosyltransferase of the KRE2 family n=1 Tax=Spathaspora passalidarum (strain NRRL Y-27907 / 11-Y1) TaxID=619300 RepID=G3AJV4_SPAPN|nr:mannosyltransferase of the KRE2 family [Spathaspora passalidarum NRRL Y-27907]EGW34005.1 mannosyltransferase of the KRE2 family [Spathaspora passalidarum NRRL Y-27907]